MSSSIAAQLTVSLLVLASVWQAGRRRVSAWPLLILGQALFLGYAVSTGQPGFWLLNVGMILAGVRNWMLWAKADHQV